MSSILSESILYTMCTIPNNFNPYIFPWIISDVFRACKHLSIEIQGLDYKCLYFCSDIGGHVDSLRVRFQMGRTNGEICEVMVQAKDHEI